MMNMGNAKEQWCDKDNLHGRKAGENMKRNKNGSKENLLARWSSNIISKVNRVGPDGSN